jgi:2-C-methyl-D-erythritol 4-phosphate cytidylyltransferase
MKTNERELATKKLSTWAIVLGGGSSTRFGSDKQCAEIGNRTLLQIGVSQVESFVEGVVVVGRSDLNNALLSSLCEIVLVDGGQSRCQSVRAGLAALPVNAGYVVIADCVRPATKPSIFRSLIEAIHADADLDGVVPVAPINDAFGVVRNGRIEAILDKENVGWMQGPHIYKVTSLREAHRGNPEANDDSKLMLTQGFRLGVVEGDTCNTHITTPTELEMVRSWMASPTWADTWADL